MIAKIKNGSVGNPVMVPQIGGCERADARSHPPIWGFSQNFRKNLKIAYLWIAGILVLSLAGCGFSGNWSEPSPTVPPSPVPSSTIEPLPDLVLTSIWINPEKSEPCPDPYVDEGVWVRVMNQGSAPAGPFIVQVNGVWQNVEQGLSPNQPIDLWFEGYHPQTEVWLDVTSMVHESDEDNNRITEGLSLPTLSADCFPVPSPVVPQQESKYTLESHTGRVLTLAFSPDGGLIASGSVDNTLKLWRVEPGSLLRTMLGHPFPISSLAFSSRGIEIATGSFDGEIRIWRVSDGQLSRTLEGHAGKVVSLAYSADGKYLATAGDDFTIRLWRTINGKLIQTIDEGLSGITSVVFSPDSKFLAWSESDGSVRLWQISDASWVDHYQEAEVAANSLAFSPDGRSLAVGYADRTVRLWRISDGSLLQTLTGHTGQVTSLAFSPDGHWLVTGSSDRQVRLWEQAEENYLYLPERILTGHTDRVNCVAFSPRGDVVASASDDQSIRIWALYP